MIHVKENFNINHQSKIYNPKSHAL